MAHLASVGSHAINGVAALHSDLLKETVLRDFHQLSPEKFCNVTNGVTPRRWIVLSNPRLTALITSRIGDRWIGDRDSGDVEVGGDDRRSTGGHLYLRVLRRRGLRRNGCDRDQDNE
jgi:glucan phosphorylase